MQSRHIQSMRRAFGLLVVIVLACASFAAASATLLLEEPYGKLGFFTATGHAAIYFSNICASSALVLRPCAPGETGVVISRYDGVGGHDWVAIPLIPYLYAVDRPEDVPLFADAKMTLFLRDHYRRRHLEDIAPDAKNGETPGGNWYELVGSSYDRTIYGFEIATTRKQDAALIRKLNSSPNESHFHTVSRNCADFAKDVLNFYFPKTMHRSIISDVGITTPKQLAKLLTKYSARHPELQFSRLIIAQVPGSMPRSAVVHGVVESFFKSKKYIVPSVAVSPIFAGCVAAVYVGSGTGRFEPGRNAMVFGIGGSPQRPLEHEDLLAFQRELKEFVAESYPESSRPNLDKAWEKVQSSAKFGMDEAGRPVLLMQSDDREIRMGLAAGNIANGAAPPELVRQLLQARLQSELHGRSPRGISLEEVERDWRLLEQVSNRGDSRLTARTVRGGGMGGNAR
jgi:hypothetical protein